MKPVAGEPLVNFVSGLAGTRPSISMKEMFMINRRKPFPSSRTVFAGLVAGLHIAAAHGEDKVLGTVDVSADPQAGWMQPDRSTPGTVYRVGSEAMRLYDRPGGTNPYTAVAEAPGVMQTNVDAYGLGNLQGGQKGIRVRGETSMHGTTGTVDGLPLGGPGPGPGSLFLFDKENLAAISIAQGAVAADRGNLFDSFGALDTELRWPGQAARREVSASFGADRFRRYFARIDTGVLTSGTALFASASDTSADKWRGFGKAPSNRGNAEIAVAQSIGNLNAKLMFVQNDQAQNNYKALTYAQATNLGTYNGYDYSNNPRSSDHYDYNRQDFRNQAVLAEIEYAFSPQTSFIFKPFYAKEEGYYLYAGSTATQVQKWLIDHSTYGFVGELRTVLAETDVKLGYSRTSSEPPGPPTTRKQYVVNNNGSLVFQQWSLLDKVTERYEFQNLYVTGQRRVAALTLQGGARYAWQRLPSVDVYKTATTNNASWDVSADAALARATLDPTKSVRGRAFGYWLPQVGAGYEFNPALEVHANLGRNIGAPALSVFTQSQSQSTWDRIRPELSSNLDVGARLRFGSLYLDPTLYYAHSRNKMVSVYDPTTTLILPQNVGNTAAKGVQLAAGWTPSDALRVFGAYSYSKSYFVEDVHIAGNAVLPVNGRQLPDVPKTMANIGVAWDVAGVTIAPVIQYIGERWATTTYTERMPGYATADLTLSHTHKTEWGSWQASLALLNAFDRKYIGQIVTSEVNTTANGAIYYQGAPRTLVAKLSASF
jgi:iron complex outermembrane receptor protein